MSHLSGERQTLAGNPGGEIRALCQPRLQLTAWLSASPSAPAAALITRGSWGWAREGRGGTTGPGTSREGLGQWDQEGENSLTACCPQLQPHPRGPA